MTGFTHAPQPTLRTDRLVLRPFTASDAAEVARLAGSIEVATTTLTIPHPYEPPMADQWIAMHPTWWDRDEQVVFAITREGDGLVGAVGLVIERAHRRGELGYWVGVPFWNQGIATEAARAVIAFGFTSLDLNRILARHLTRNPSSGRVMAKLGMRFEGVQRQHVVKWGVPEDLVEYAIVRSDDAAGLSRDGAGDPPSPLLYTELADWWPLLSTPADYVEEAAFYRQHLVRAATRPIETVLELGSGGGNNASHLKRHFRMTLVDRSPGMLAVSRQLNPECEHVDGDMRTVRLNRLFDAVFVHDAVCYLTTERDLRLAMLTAVQHCRPGGAVLFAPDFTRENFRLSTDHGGHDGEGRGLRYLEWTTDPDPSDSTYLVDFAYLLREAGGATRVKWDRHVEGLFARQDWLRWLHEAGLDARVIPFEHSEVDPCTHEIFVGVKRGA
jgi:RimJ/RimL family protein N-acetyltransferase/SAM-dependent methyltransferase